MQKRFRVNVDGRDFDVVVEEISAEGGAGAGTRLRVGSHRPHAGGAAAAARRSERERGRRGPGRRCSGVVESLPVAVGTAVAVGIVVAVIEAMKMKTEVISRVRLRPLDRGRRRSAGRGGREVLPFVVG